jgi:hypothetical protein
MTKEVQVEVVPQAKSHKYAKLILGILFDLIGMMSYIVPVAAEVTDVVWAPLSAFIMTRMYKGNVGKIAGVVDFLEELLPATDIIPTFTLTWIYVYVIGKES